MLTMNRDELERNGLILLKDVLSPADIAEFEPAISEFCGSELRKRNIAPIARDPFIDVFARNGAYYHRVYKLLERLYVLHRMSVDVGEKLRSAGFFDWAEIEVPLVWPDIRADLPNQTDDALL